MNEWIEFDKETPPEYKSPTDPPATYYEVMLKDGTITRLCWWLGHWYCSIDNGNVFYWRQLEDK